MITSHSHWTAAPPMPQDPLRNFGYLLASVHRLYAQLFERHSGDLGLSLTQCRVLSYLARNEGASQARVAEGTSTDQMTLVRILDRMEQDGWIERRANPEDRRANRLYLRTAAKPLLNRIWRLSDRLRGKALAQLEPAERQQLVGLLERAHETLMTLDVSAERTLESSHSPVKTARSTPKES